MLVILEKCSDRNKPEFGKQLCCSWKTQIFTSNAGIVVKAVCYLVWSVSILMEDDSTAKWRKLSLQPQALILSLFITSFQYYMQNYENAKQWLLLKEAPEVWNIKSLNLSARPWIINIVPKNLLNLLCVVFLQKIAGFYETLGRKPFQFHTLRAAKERIITWLYPQNS